MKQSASRTTSKTAPTHHPLTDRVKPAIYIGTGGYSDTDLIGTLYPHHARPSDFLSYYANHYDCVEINSSFHAPIGRKALLGMQHKAAGRLKFSIKLHQSFSHTRTATAQTAKEFLQTVMPLGEHLAPLLLQFPHSFQRHPANRRYLGELVKWFAGYPLAIELRHPSWHIMPVFEHFVNSPDLIWVNADYPKGIGLPNTPFWSSHRTAYYRLHGNNHRWWHETTAKARHDYRYGEKGLDVIADSIATNEQNFDEIFIYFQNTTNAHAFYDIKTLKHKLLALGLDAKSPHLVGQGDLFS
ncbi:DUF72 domain-containing protein [Moraxella ovis]|uniref:DUF72 domain-containing protein n=1 Tax=Moraxella ovis TaxID=29433 RepID=UPI000D9FDF03|nr:DUF72 domain-containing protein [Moraxella ovis]SPX85717.1 Protein of uncharacterised function DUF72 [Moraxella ovis]STZ05482.1 Protein of uncharacterised function DUF72 [Moraxella ovis]